MSLPSVMTAKRTAKWLWDAWTRWPRLNGELRQDGNTRDLIFSIDHLLRYITEAMTLFPGDLILTGTPAGVAPMQPGDRVEVSVDGIGTLMNPIL